MRQHRHASTRRTLGIALAALFLLPVAPALARPSAPARQPAVARLRSLGAAGVVTGSMHLVQVGDRSMLVDCGMFQGNRELKARNQQMPRDAVQAQALVLTHAHIDHSGRIPQLVKEGFRGKIYCTPATADLCKTMLMDSARIQEREAKWANTRQRRHQRGGKKGAPAEIIRPAYSVQDVEQALSQFVPVALQKAFSPLPGVQAQFLNAGHILGAASAVLDINRGGRSCRVAFSGDIGRKNAPLLQDPQTPRDVDYAVMESTYGGRLHPPRANAKAKLQQVIDATAARGGKVVIPAFSLQRTQQLLHLLSQLHGEGKLRVPVYLDSPLATAATEVFQRHPQLLNDRVKNSTAKQPFTFPGLQVTKSVDQSKAIQNVRMPAVIISASGMCTAGRVVHHLAANLDDPRNSVLIAGYQGRGTLGRQLTDGKKSVQIKGRQVDVRASIEQLEGFSGHADHDGLINWATACGANVKGYFLVHGEPDSAKALQQALGKRGRKATIVAPDQTYELMPRTAIKPARPAVNMAAAAALP